MDDVDCPKAMTHGPCGGVRLGGGCEVDQRPCPFMGLALVPGPRRRTTPLGLEAPAIIVDVRAPLDWRGDSRALWRRTAATLAGCVALIGEHVDNPVQLDDSGALAPDEVVGILGDAGVPAIVTITGRDRDQSSARRLVERYRAAGAHAIHCVTGDHPAALGIDRPASFGTESVALLAATSVLRAPATVAESPDSLGPRAQRLALKAAAGASGCILNHGGDADELVAFADAARAAGADLPLFAPVPMVADRRSAVGLAGFPGVRLPTGYLEDIIDAAHPDERGLALAVDLTTTLMRSGRFAGINLSGGAGGSTPNERLDMTARFITAVHAAMATVTG